MTSVNSLPIRAWSSTYQ